MTSWSGVLRSASALALMVACGSVMTLQANSGSRHRALDPVLTERAATGLGTSRVIVTFKPGGDASGAAKRLGARLGRRLNLTRGQVMELPNAQLYTLADHPAVENIRWDRPIFALPDVQADGGDGPVQRGPSLEFTGKGVGVAILDSGITPWHDDLTYSGASPRVWTKGGQRVAAFVDFVNDRTEPYDDYGHGTHVAGVIAGNGIGTNGLRKGSAPDAHLVVLKVLDATGRGHISNVLAALEFVLQTKATYRIGVVNMSIAAPVLNSVYDRDADGLRDDLLARSTEAIVEAGIVVVAAAGNLGRNAAGATQYGGITAPGNAPWVVTVGAYSREGTATTRDDVVTPFSSRGPTAIDFLAKPDLVAPGAGIVSMTDPSSALHAKKAANGTPGPYVTLSGTSVAAPAVSGTVALMIEANPRLTPNLAKGILQYTARYDADYDPLTQGAGYLDPRGAVELAKYFATARAGDAYPSSRTWTRTIIWGNYRISGGVLSSAANAWAIGTTWGDALTEDGDNIVWGTLTEDGDNIVWGTTCADEDCDNIVWGTTEDVDNIVWGTDCGGEDCDNIVWGTVREGGEDVDNIVWGTAEDVDNIVWGTICFGEDCDNIVWGTDCSREDCDNIVWGTGLQTISPAAGPVRRRAAGRKQAALKISP